VSPISLTVNGSRVEVDLDPDTTLLHVLREELGLKGARFGCGMGLCGACFVRMDDAVVPSCDTPMWSAEGRSVVTVEGLADGEDLHPVQEALLAHQAAQCGYCTAGIAVTCATAVDRSTPVERDELVTALDRHLCRCGTQSRVIDAVLSVGQRDEAQS
jgi:nicotinate dehydrogenase subunit A